MTGAQPRPLVHVAARHDIVGLRPGFFERCIADRPGMRPGAPP